MMTSIRIRGCKKTGIVTTAPIGHRLFALAVHERFKLGRLAFLRRSGGLRPSVMESAPPTLLETRILTTHLRRWIMPCLGHRNALANPVGWRSRAASSSEWQTGQPQDQSARSDRWPQALGPNGRELCPSLRLLRDSTCSKCID